MNLYGARSETAFTTKNKPCQLHIIVRVLSSRKNHSIGVRTSQIQRFKTPKWFQWTFLNSPKQSPCTGKGAGINTFSPAILLARSDVNLQLLSSSLASSVQDGSPHFHHHNNKTLGGFQWWKQAKPKVPQVTTAKLWISCLISMCTFLHYQNKTVILQDWNTVLPL